MGRWVRVCNSWEEEAEADREYWLRFSPDERVALIDTMRVEWADMTNSMKPTRDQADFLGCLARHGVRALLIGAHALAYHAKPRYTRDLDVFVEASEDNARRIIAALEEFGFGALGLQVADLSTPGQIVQLGHEPNRIDIITRISGVTFEEAWRNRVKATYAGEEVFFIGKEELIRNKEASGRTQDLADAELLRRFL
jgi:hypothetical protein